MSYILQPYHFEAEASPFTWKASDLVIPHGFVIPQIIGSYDGTTDPDDHMFVFTQTLDIFNLSEQVWCSLFPVTLSGAARIWFKSLTPRSISSFDQLTKSFRIMFLHKVRFQHTIIEIGFMKQGWNEPFKEYVDRFIDEMLKVGDRKHQIDQSDQLLICYFIKGLQPGKYLSKFTSKTPATLEELLVRVNKYSRGEDFTARRRVDGSKRSRQSFQ